MLQIISSELQAPPHLFNAKVIREERTRSGYPGFYAGYSFVFEPETPGSLSGFHSTIWSEWRRLGSPIDSARDVVITQPGDGLPAVLISFSSESWQQFREYQLLFESHMELTTPISGLGISLYSESDEEVA